MTILVDPDRYGRTRDELYVLLKQFNVHPRKYFHPLCSHIPAYASLPTADPGQLPVAERIASQILCLPLYGSLEEDSVERVCAIVEGLVGGR
jgi:dTDP-4-amino-4,6-dideoxygalactose transaminase